MAEITPPADRMEDLRIERELQDSYLTYAMSTIMDRALPDVHDGLKPSQRRILVAMNDLGLGPRAKSRKCAKIAGDTSGNYHPHGESVIYPTLVRMAQSFNMRVPLVIGQGNFGSVDGDPPAAMRYTEAKMSGPAMELLADLEKETVDLKPNYDETRLEPTVLPGLFPNLLVNGASGIAVAMASSIPPHNVGEVCDAITALLRKPEITIPELMKHIPGPDFPTGGRICGRQAIKDAYATGRAILEVRAKCHVESGRRGLQQIVVDEIPFQVNKKTLIEKISNLVKDDKITGIADIVDKVIALIRKSKDAPTAREGLVTQHAFSVAQADAILRMQLQKLTGLERKELEAEHKDLIAKIGEYKAILGDEKLVLQMIE